MLAHERSSDRWGLDELYPFASGVLLALSLPPFHLSFLALVALVPLFLYLDRPVTVKRIVRAGVITAVVYFGINLNWLIVVGRFSWLIYPGYATILFIYTCNFFVFVLTVVSYCSQIQCLEQRFGEAMRRRKSSVTSPSATR